MPRGYRCIVVAAVIGLTIAAFGTGVFWTLLAHSQEQHEQTEAAYKRTEQHRQHPQQSDTDRAGVLRFAERLISNPEPSDDTEREHRDLAAQEATAAWAFWVVVLAVAQFFLSGVGLLALLKTIRQGEAGLREASAATRAAIESNKISRAASRPWITVQGMHVTTVPTGVIDGVARKNFLIFAINLLVTGGRPALMRQAVSDYSVNDSRTAPPFFTKPLEAVNNAFTPGISVTSGPSTPTQEELNDILGHRRFLWLYAQYIYIDPAEPERQLVSEMCGYARYIGNGQDGRAIFHIEQHGAQNKLT